VKERLFDRRHERVALALQGGGALGAYEAGAYEALAELGYAPNWLVGVSIGALNAALIAGNPPERRVECPREFWHFVSADLGELPAPPPGAWRTAYQQGTALRAALYGVPGFSAPSVRPQWSIYGTSALRDTLERLVDFDRVNARETRLSVGAVDVATGASTYFDSRHRPIRAEHIVATCALPPGLPPVEVAGAFYWDGAIVTNTPLQYVLDDKPRANTLVFQVDLYSARGALPVDLDGVRRRRKEIAYSSRTRFDTDSLVTAQRLRQSLDRLTAKLPRKLRHDPDLETLRRLADTATVDVVRLIRRAAADEPVSAEYEFSRASVEERWRSGYADVMRMNSHREQLVDSNPELGVRVYQVREPQPPPRPTAGEPGALPPLVAWSLA
jgi:NTE family protein